MKWILNIAFVLAGLQICLTDVAGIGKEEVAKSEADATLEKEQVAKPEQAERSEENSVKATQERNEVEQSEKSIDSVPKTEESEAAEDKAEQRDTSEIPGSEDAIDISKYENIYTADDEEAQAPVVQATRKEGQKIERGEIDILIDKVEHSVYELDQLANKSSIPLRDCSVCRVLAAEYKNLALYLRAMKSSMHDLKLFLTYVEVCIGNIYFFYSPTSTIGITKSTGEKLKQIKYQYVDTGKSQGTTLEVIKKMVQSISDQISITEKPTAVVKKSIFDF